jgi:GTP-binding protein EngB required for normal cell division
LIQFLNEFNIPLLILFNKIDRVSNFNQKKIISLFIDSIKEYGMNLIHLDEINFEKMLEIPYLEFSALKKINLLKLKRVIQKYLEQI